MASCSSVRHQNRRKNWPPHEPYAVSLISLYQRVSPRVSNRKSLILSMKESLSKETSLQRDFSLLSSLSNLPISSPWKGYKLFMQMVRRLFCLKIGIRNEECCILISNYEREVWTHEVCGHKGVRTEFLQRKKLERWRLVLHSLRHTKTHFVLHTRQDSVCPVSFLQCPTM